MSESEVTVDEVLSEAARAIDEAENRGPAVYLFPGKLLAGLAAWVKQQDVAEPERLYGVDRGDAALLRQTMKGGKEMAKCGKKNGKKKP